MSRAGEFVSKHFALCPVAEGVYAAIASDGGGAVGNAGLVDLGGLVLVFDSFMTPQAAADLRTAALAVFGQAPRLVVNSHYHNDHSWGNQAFAAEATIVASAGTRELMATSGQQEFEYYSANSTAHLASHRAKLQAAGSEEERQQAAFWIPYYEALVEAVPSLHPCLPGITFTGSLELHGHARSAQLLDFRGGHTGSDTVLYLREDSVVFAGDLLFVGAHPYLAEGDPIRLLNTLRQLTELGATRIVPGHGPVGGPADLQAMVDYVETCLATAQDLLRAGESGDAQLAALRPPERFRDWRLPQFFTSTMRYYCSRLREEGSNAGGSSAV